MQCIWELFQCGHAAHTTCARKLEGRCVAKGCGKVLVLEIVMTPDVASQRAFLNEFQNRMTKYGDAETEMRALIVDMETMVKAVVESIGPAIAAEYEGVVDLVEDTREK